MFHLYVGFISLLCFGSIPCNVITFSLGLRCHTVNWVSTCRKYVLHATYSGDGGKDVSRFTVANV